MEIILGKRIPLSVPHCDDMDAGNNRLYPLEKMQDGSEGPNLSEAGDRALLQARGFGHTANTLRKTHHQALMAHILAWCSAPSIDALNAIPEYEKAK